MHRLNAYTYDLLPRLERIAAIDEEDCIVGPNQQNPSAAGESSQIQNVRKMRDEQ